MATLWWARGAVALSVVVLLSLVLSSQRSADDDDDGQLNSRYFALDRRKREDSHLVVSHLTKSNEIRPRRRKGNRRKFPNGTFGFRKRKKGQRRYNVSSAGLLMPQTIEDNIISNTIIRTSEADGPNHRLLIQTLRRSNSSGVRYFANYPVEWKENRGASHDRSPDSRYGDTSLNWRGLRYGKKIL